MIRAGARAFFFDTWGFLALANDADPDHDVAAAADEWLARRRYVVVTSDFVLDETLTGLHSVAGAAVALRFLDLLDARVEADSIVLVEVDRDRRERAIALFRRLAPTAPRLSFTDCSSFAIMRELGLELAFTADRHFHRAGARIRPLFERPRRGRLRWLPPVDA